MDGLLLGLATKITTDRGVISATFDDFERWDAGINGAGKMRFKASVWVRASNLQVLPVNTVEDARAILRRWPHQTRVGLFVEVRELIEKAAAGIVTTEEARLAFVSLLDQQDMRAESDPA